MNAHAHGSIGTLRDTAGADSSASTRADWLWLGAILMIAVTLRVFKLDASLWFDEVETLVHHTRQPVWELFTTYPSLNHHVLFTLQAKGAIALFGESAWALRLPALVFGVASVWALWLLARQVVAPWEARLATLMLAVSYHHVWFSQNARGYTGMLFWCLLGTYFFLRGARQSSWGTWSAFGAVSALAMYTHLSATLFIAAQGFVYLGIFGLRLIVSPDRSAWASGVSGGLAGTLPLYGFALAGGLALLFHAPLIPQMISTFTEVAGSQPAAGAAAVAEWKSVAWMVREVALSLGPVMAIALPAVVIIIGLGMFDLRKSAPVLPAILLVHIPLTLIILSVASMRIWPRYFFIDLGLLCLFLVHGTFVLGRTGAHFVNEHLHWRLDGRVLGAGLAALGICASLVLLPKNYLHPKQDLLGARDFVEANRAVGSSVAVLGLAASPYADYYAPQWNEIKTPDDLEKLRGAHGEVWVVYAFPGVTERRYPDVAAYLSTRFERIKRFPGTLGGGDVLAFRSKPELR